MSRQSYRFRRTRRTRRTRPQYVREQPVWPLPALTGHPPVIITIDQVTREAVLAYGRQLVDNASTGAVGKDGAASPFFMPDSTPVLAIKSGVAWATLHDGVYEVTIDHGNGFSSFYEGLHDAIVPASDRRRAVKAGEVIGTIRSPASALHPLRLTLSRTDLVPGLPGFPRAVDPLDVLLGTISIPLASASPREEAA